MLYNLLITYTDGNTQEAFISGKELNIVLTMRDKLQDINPERKLEIVNADPDKRFIEYKIAEAGDKNWSKGYPLEAINETLFPVWNDTPELSSIRRFYDKLEIKTEYLMARGILRVETYKDLYYEEDPAPIS